MAKIHFSSALSTCKGQLANLWIDFSVCSSIWKPNHLSEWFVFTIMALMASNSWNHVSTPSAGPDLMSVGHSHWWAKSRRYFNLPSPQPRLLWSAMNGPRLRTRTQSFCPAAAITAPQWRAHGPSAARVRSLVSQTHPPPPRPCPDPSINRSRTSCFPGAVGPHPVLRVPTITARWALWEPLAGPPSPSLPCSRTFWNRGAVPSPVSTLPPAASPVGEARPWPHNPAAPEAGLPTPRQSVRPDEGSAPARPSQSLSPLHLSPQHPGHRPHPTSGAPLKPPSQEAFLDPQPQPWLGWRPSVHSLQPAPLPPTLSSPCVRLCPL